MIAESIFARKNDQRSFGKGERGTKKYRLVNGQVFFAICCNPNRAGSAARSYVKIESKTPAAG